MLSYYFYLGIYGNDGGGVYWAPAYAIGEKKDDKQII